jgi:hypothetical protein
MAAHTPNAPHGQSQTQGQSQAQTAIQLDDPEPGSTWFISIASTIIFLVIVFALCAMYFQVNKTQETERVINVPVAEYESVRLAQKAKLADSAKWIEEIPGEKAGEVTTIERQRIPIEDAMKLVGAELSGTAGGSKNGGVKQ